MNENGIVRFQLPEASWNTLKKIIRAYYAKRNSQPVTVKEVAEAAGLHRPQVSGSNNFLKAFGILEEDSYKLTPLGSELAVGVAREDQFTIQQSLSSLVNSCAPLRSLIELIQARGEIEKESFNTQILLTLDVDSGDRRLQWVSTILDILEESGTIKIDGSTIRAASDIAPVKIGKPLGVAEEEVQTRVDSMEEREDLKRIPVPISPTKLWYVQVALNPSPEEIKKFLDMQRLIFDAKE